MSLDYKVITTKRIMTIASAIVVYLFVFSGNVVADKIHDPTLPKVDLTPATATDSTSTKTELELQGVVNKRGIKMAFISGELVKIGDQVQDFKVSKINNNNVVLLKSGSQKRLYVYEK